MRSAFHKFSTALEVIEGHNFAGKVAIVTGGANGIGTETTRALAAKGAHVIVGARSRERALPVLEQLKKDTKNDKIELIEIDLESLATVKKFVEEFKAKQLPLHLLIANAGIMASPQGKTVDGFEKQFGTNHLAHFYLVNLLLPILKANTPSRVVVLSSIAHRKNGIFFDDIHFEKSEYDKWASYAQSKSANALFALELNNRYSNAGITAVSVHPGGIMTGLQKDLSIEEQKKLGWINDDGSTKEGFKNTEQGASTSIWGAVASELEGNGGHYLEDCSIADPATPDKPWAGVHPHVRDNDAAKRLWDVSVQMLNEKGYTF